MKDSRSRIWEAIIVAEVLIAMLVFYIVTSRKQQPSSPSVPESRPVSIAGKWHGTQKTRSGDLEINLALHDDQTFRCILRGRDVVDIAGQWRIKDNALELEVEQVNHGDPDAVGRKMQFGQVRELDEHRLTLETADGKTTYLRESE